MSMLTRFYQEQESLRTLVRSLVAANDVTTLDVGCKKGDTTTAIAARQREGSPQVQGTVVGVDIQRHPDWHTRESLHGVEYVQADGQSLPFANDSFDVVVACESLQYMPSAEAAVDEMWRVLRADGRLVLTFPEGGPLTDALDPDNLAYLARRVLRRPGGSHDRFLRHLRSERIVNRMLQCGLTLDLHLRRGSLAYIHLASVIDLLHAVYTRARQSPPLRWIAELAIRPVMRLSCRLMQLDFAVGYGQLSYNNVLVARKRAGRSSEIAPAVASDRRAHQAQSVSLEAVDVA